MKKPIYKRILNRISRFPFKRKLKDRSKRCDGNDDNLKNKCWYCIYFCFPVGCMKGDE